MALTTAQSRSLKRLRSIGASAQAVRLTDDAIRCLIYIATADLGIQLADTLAPQGVVPKLFDPDFVGGVVLPGAPVAELYEAALQANPEVETYVHSLASIHKARLKYRQVLSSQQFPSMDQVAPRGLLQYGQLSPAGLAALLVWRKWLFDLDNRAAQDTGYLFEPVIASAIGGTPASSAKSPIRRLGRAGGRQVDCIKGQSAYEIKIRITIAASGQGRWAEELSFPAEARASGFEPILVVLDPTPNPKLAEVQRAFLQSGGRVYLGEDAWQHLRDEAGPEMGTFLENYVRLPLEDIYAAFDETETLPDLTVSDHGRQIHFSIGDETWTVQRDAHPDLEPEPEPALRADVSDGLPGID